MSRVFFDMDGVLARMTEFQSEDELLRAGYFRDLEPQSEVIEAMNELAAMPGFEVCTLSAVLEGNPYALGEKREWLGRHVRSVREGRAGSLFLPCGESKREAVPGGIRPDDILIDDYNVNLGDWQHAGIAIKLLNGCNDRRGTWQGIRARMDRRDIVSAVLRAAGAAAKASD